MKNTIVYSEVYLEFRVRETPLAVTISGGSLRLMSRRDTVTLAGNSNVPRNLNVRYSKTFFSVIIIGSFLILN